MCLCIILNVQTDCKELSIKKQLRERQGFKNGHSECACSLTHIGSDNGIHILDLTFLLPLHSYKYIWERSIFCFSLASNGLINTGLPALCGSQSRRKTALNSKMCRMELETMLIYWDLE